MKLFDNYGGYNYRSFTGDKGTWTIIGTKCQSNHKNPMLCIDTFKSDTGEYLEIKREQVSDYFDQGLIHPVESSLIKPLPSQNKTKRRAI